MVEHAPVSVEGGLQLRVGRVAREVWRATGRQRGGVGSVVTWRGAGTCATTRTGTCTATRTGTCTARGRRGGRVRQAAVRCCLWARESPAYRAVGRLGSVVDVCESCGGATGAGSDRPPCLCDLSPVPAAGAAVANAVASPRESGGAAAPNAAVSSPRESGGGSHAKALRCPSCGGWLEQGVRRCGYCRGWRSSRAPAAGAAST